MRPPEFWTRSNFSACAASFALSPIGWLYGANVACKRDRTTPYRAKAKVVCVGNITAGGSGKTPVAIAVARALLARGARVAILTRGYGGRTTGPVLVKPDEHGARDLGDEPLLLARIAPTIVARDRAAGARLADTQGADVIVMDDGHQNFTLAKDLSIVVVDAESGFGNGRVLPAGPLREPARQGLVRADAVVLVGHGLPDLPGYRGAAIRAHLSPTLSPPANARVIAFAGIGRPEKFFSTLRTLGADVVECHAFADHHPYTYDEISRLKADASKTGAVLMTTEKDYVRLNEEERAGVLTLPVRAVFAVPEELERLLDGIAGRTRVPS